MAKKVKRTIAQRFWSLVKPIKSEPQCWEWQGAVNHKGYGQFKINGCTMRSNRVAWMLTFGAIPDGLHVLHKCDNPKCCKPEHLFLGTNLENVQDKIRKGRHVRKTTIDKDV